MLYRFIANCNATKARKRAMKGYDAIPEPPVTHEVPHARSFTTGRTSVPQSDDESESRAGSPPLAAAVGFTLCPSDGRESRVSIQRPRTV